MVSNHPSLGSCDFKVARCKEPLLANPVLIQECGFDSLSVRAVKVRKQSQCLWKFHDVFGLTFVCNFLCWPFHQSLDTAISRTDNHPKQFVAGSWVSNFSCVTAAFTGVGKLPQPAYCQR